MRPSLKPKNSRHKESAGVPISTAAVCIIKCIIIKINGAIVVKQSFPVFFEQPKEKHSYIHVYVCMYGQLRPDAPVAWTSALTRPRLASTRRHEFLIGLSNMESIHPFLNLLSVILR